MPLINHNPTPDPSPSGSPRCCANRSGPSSHSRDGPASHPSTLATLELEVPWAHWRLGGSDFYRVCSFSKDPCMEFLENFKFQSFGWWMKFLWYQEDGKDFAWDDRSMK